MKTSNSSRRDFISKVAIGSIGALSIPNILLSAEAEKKPKRISINTGDTILFQGDSITDAGRSRTDMGSNTQKGFGGGYAFLAAAELLNAYPEKKLKIYNRGVSGNKVHQLAERWEIDALNLKPTIISILIGVNDYWHLVKNGYKGTLEIYRNDYRALLQRTKEKLPDVKFIIGEPFAIMGSAVDKSWFPPFGEYQNASQEIAKEFNAVFIPYQKIFDKALEIAPGSYWAPDGVHPTMAGAKLMADAWLEAVKR
ncbi:MAG: SGNH/GDSL hydrolase family protein [Sphingobacteriaceae bacterium]|nr:SGNH/GDSL hydrolase family protein [Sphingobacteriaceae bacterium]